MADSAGMAAGTTQRPGAQEWVPAGAGIDQLRAAAPDCRGCELYRPATQVVFSAGSPTARLALVGEQPGDAEDRAGEPFVGPAGRLLDRALADAGIDRADAYVTNAVKHFRFTPTAKRRLHQTPDMAHLVACRPWLTAELAVVDPEVVVCLGASAARSLLGPSFRVTRQRGQLIPRQPSPPSDGDVSAVRSGWLMGTIHPSAVLRAPRGEAHDAAYAGLVDDLRIAAAALSA